MDYTVVDMPAVYVVGLSVRTSNKTASKDISELMQRFHEEAWYEKIEHKISPDVVAVYTEYEGDYTQPYTYLMGCKVSDISQVPAGMTSVELHGGKYAKIDVQGQFPDSLIQARQEIWQSDLPRAYKTDYEVYGPNFTPEDHFQHTIYIGIKE